jgi:LysM repeat protein
VANVLYQALPGDPGYGYDQPAVDQGYGEPAGGYGYDQLAVDQGYGEPAGGYGYDQPAVDQGYGEPAGGYGYDQPAVDQGYGEPAGGYGYDQPAVDQSYGYGAPADVAGYGHPGYGGCTYVVRPGDTLSWIAKTNGTTVWELQRLNGLANPNFIYVGQVLTLPGCGGPVPQPPGCVQPCGGPVIEPLPLPHPGPGGCVDSCGGPTPRTYTVRPGDTLSGIAARFGVDFYTLCQVNGIRNPNFIYVGQVLVIP